MASKLQSNPKILIKKPYYFPNLVYFQVNSVIKKKKKNLEIK